MSDQAIHPSPEELSAFSLGQLSPGAAAAVECHISECEPCCETMLSLSSGDTFVAMLQEANQQPTAPTLDQDRQSASDRPLTSEIPEPLAEHPRYEIVHLIGKGGMGDVYQARHRMMERTVAIKIINRELVRKPEAVDRFQREVKTAASLSHANIVTAHDAEQAGDVHFLVMEFVDGVDLARLVKQCGPLPIAKACDYIGQAARGLQYAHDRGMVHRDIKPHNLMVTDDGIVKILDFGLATLSPEALVRVDPASATGELTAAGSIMGTPDFIAPEQAVDAHQADIRSDIYSLGATLYYLLSGHAPFAEQSVMHKLKSHAEVEPEPIENLLSDVPAKLAEVLRRMMAKNPAERFQAPEEVAIALARVDPYRIDPTIAEPQPLAGPRRQPPRTWIKLALGALAIGLAGLIYVVTDTGTLVIESDDESVEIAVRPATDQAHEGNKYSPAMQYRIGDITTGSTIKRLRSGAYLIDLKGRENEYELSQDRFVLKRGGKVIVTVTRRDDAEVARAMVAPQAVPIPRVQLPKQVFSGSEATRGITAMAVSADGKQLLAGNHGGGIGVWDIASGKQLRSLDGHKGMVHSIDISSDGRLAVTGGEEPLRTEASLATGSTKKSGIAIVWDLTTGEKLRELDSHHARVQVVRFSPDDKLILTVNADFADNRENSAWLWKAADGTLIRELDINHEWIVDAEFSPDGERIAAVGQKNRRVAILDVASGNRIHLLPQVQGSLNCVAFSPEGRHLVAGHKGLSPASGTWNDPRGCVLRMYDATTFEHIRTFRGHAGPVVDAVFSPDGRWLLSVASGAHDRHGIWQESSDNSVRLWNVATGNELVRFEVGDRTDVVAFTHDGMEILTGGIGLLGLRLWSLPEDLTIQNNSEATGQAEIINSARHGASAAPLKEVRQFTARKGAHYKVTVGPNEQSVLAVAVHDSAARLWNIADGRQVGEFPGVFAAAAFCPNGERFIAGTHHPQGAPTNELVIWDIESGAKLQTLPASTGVFTDVDLSRDGRWVASSHGQWWGEFETRDNSIRIWDLESSTLLHEIRDEGNPAQIDSVAFTPDGEMLVSSGGDGIVRLWDVKSGTLIREFRGTGTRAHAAAVSPDGRRVLAGFGPHAQQGVSEFGIDDPEHCIAILWNLDTGDEVQRFVGHHGAISDVGFSPDGSLVGTGSGSAYVGEVRPGESNYRTSDDKTMRIWNAHTGEQLAVVLHRTPVASVDFSPDGRYLISGETQMFHVWRVPRSVEVPAAAADPAVRQLLVSSNRGGEFDIYLIDEYGTDWRNLTAHPAEDTGPAWSADGSQIAFCSNRSGNLDVWVMNADGSEPRQLTDYGGIDRTPAWSPDGKRIAFVRHLPDDNWEIFAMDADGSNEVNLSNHPNREADPAWSPDGTRIAFNFHADAGARLHVMDSDGSNPRMLSPRPGSFVYPAWSPDGSWIVYTAWVPQIGEQLELFTARADGSHERQLTDLGGLNTFAALSSDGEKIAFQHRNPNKPGVKAIVHVMNADGTELRPITGSEAHIGYGGGRPAWRPRQFIQAAKAHLHAEKAEHR